MNVTVTITIDDINTLGAIAWRLGLDRAPTEAEVAGYLATQADSALRTLTADWHDAMAAKAAELSHERAMNTWYPRETR